MNKLLIIAGLMILLFSSPVMAQELARPWLLPDNPFYPLQTAIERIQLMLTTDPESRARLHLQFAERRLVELNETIVRVKFQYALKLRTEYENEMNETEKEINRTVALGRNATVLAEHVSNVTYKHILVLERVLEKVPDQAKPAIEHVINVSIRGHERAVERILARINKTEEEVRRFNCTTDADCRHLFCPQVLGSDTPICEEGKCKCGGRWQIRNKTEWRERFGEELTNETERMQEKIKGIHCLPCPQYSMPSPQWYTNCEKRGGRVVPPLPNVCGCFGPPRCVV